MPRNSGGSNARWALDTCLELRSCVPSVPNTRWPRTGARTAVNGGAVLTVGTCGRPARRIADPAADTWRAGDRGQTCLRTAGPDGVRRVGAVPARPALA